MATLKEKVLGTPGYDASLRLSEIELGALRRMVRCKYEDAVYIAGILNCGNHSFIFTKVARLLPHRYVDSVCNMPFMQTLRAEFGNFTLSKVILPDGTQEDREEIYWRIVRPNHPEDVGKLHRDSDFHKQYGIEQGKQTVKCWIPLWCEPNCGLMLKDRAPAEHPLWDGAGYISTPGAIVLFSADTQHQGMLNTGTTARVSVEMTLVLE